MSEMDLELLNQHLKYKKWQLDQNNKIYIAVSDVYC